MPNQACAIAAVHGQIIEFESWPHHVNIIAMSADQTQRILIGNGLDPNLAAQIKAGQLIVLNHRQELNAIAKDTENNFRMIKKNPPD